MTEFLDESASQLGNKLGNKSGNKALNDVNELLSESVSEPAVKFTDSAALKVKSLIEEEGNDALKLRAYITGGGCSGFQYGFTFDEQVNDDDFQFENQGVILLIDAMSYQYLMGAEIDYTEGMEGAHFVIRNPNAKTTCGCGSSFAVADADAGNNPESEALNASNPSNISNQEKSESSGSCGTKKGGTKSGCC
jgi:iron-sulfur cluster insertion protein